MKVSVNWIQEYLSFQLPPIAELVDKIGSQLGGVEEVIATTQKYAGVVVVRVAECQTLEGSDHLNVCRIDDAGTTPNVNRGDDGFIQVVCGAPNVRAGITVAWLPPGSTVPSSFDTSEPFVLGARELRGTLSNGMLASPKELAIGDDHDGILEIDGEHQPGVSFAKVFGLDDHIIEIENKMFTHRPDCFGQLGVAREVAGILGQPFDSSQLYRANLAAHTGQDSSMLQINNEIPELVPRFAAQIFDNITVAPSPVWLQAKLSRVGLRPINNVVDITNYVMMLTGQPLHAYDYDKVVAVESGTDSATITIRQPHDGETLELLNGKQITPRPEAIVIATASAAIGLGGVMGGASTEVDSNTRRIILESASFDMYSIRRTSMQHGLFSDAVTRFNKGQSPLQNLQVLDVARQLLVDVALARPAETIYDDCHVPPETIERGALHPAITVQTVFINQRLGLNLSAEDMAKLLRNVEFDVVVTEAELRVSAPFWRTDIELREDVVEEVGRLYGFDYLPLVLPTHTLMPAAKDPALELKATIRKILSKAGANELLTYSFVHGNLLDKAGQDKQLAFKLSNALSPELQYYRLSLTPSILEKVHPNIKAGFDSFALFEIGKVHMQSHSDDPESPPQDVPSEHSRIALVVAADAKSSKHLDGAAFYSAKLYLTTLLSALGVGDLVKIHQYNPDHYVGSSKTKTSHYAKGRTATIMLGDYCLGEVGEYTAGVRKALKLPDYCAGFELDLGLLLQYQDQAARYQPLSRYPKLSQDITLQVPAAVSYQQVHDLVQVVVQALQTDQYWLTVAPVDIYQNPDDPGHKRVTIRITIADYFKTLTDAEVTKLLDQVTQAAKDQLQAERI